MRGLSARGGGGVTKYLEDSYVREFAARVERVTNGRYVVLNQTYFYPRGGGQPHDEGFLRRERDGRAFKIVFVGKFDGVVSHEVEEEGLLPGDEVSGVIDWERRYALMRAHTAAHLISALIHRGTGALITGNQLSPGRVRIDFSLEEFRPELFERFVAEANRLVVEDLPVETSVVPREEALQQPALSKLAAGLPEGIEEVRLVTIKGLDTQACGGTHVKRLSEIGSLSLLKCENKGRQNRRVYVALS